MNRSDNLFYQMAQKVNKNDVFDRIIAKQLFLYDLQPYKIENTYAQTMKKIYQGIENKYEITKELEIDPNNWNQNERRVFIWFIICYSYFAEIQGKTIGQEDWVSFSKVFFQKQPQFLNFQYLNLLKIKKRIPWTIVEDDLLAESIEHQKAGKWNEISKRIFFNSNGKIFRSPKHCRQRWLNHLDKKKIHGDWKAHQDYQIFKFVNQNGKRWSKIVTLLSETRTQHMIKNRYNSLISKNKTSKKQKEEEILHRILKQLGRHLENQKKQELNKQVILKIQSAGTQEDLQKFQGQKNEIKQASEVGTEAICLNGNNLGLPGIYLPYTYNSNINYGCYVDLNTMMTYIQMSQMYTCPPQIYNSSHNFNTLQTTKNSSFTYCSQINQ